MLFTSVTRIHEVSETNVIVYDSYSRRAMLLDAALHVSSAVASTGPLALFGIDSPVWGFIPWLGDSVLIVSPEMRSLHLIDKHGKVIRALRMPRPPESLCLARGLPSADAAGRIVCRIPPSMSHGDPIVRSGVDIPQWKIDDSAALVRFDPRTGSLDTVTFLRSAKTRTTFVQNASCEAFIQPLINPMPVVDEWTVTADGSIAVLRVADSRVDWYAEDSRVRVSPRLPLARKRLTAHDKAAYVDSTRAALQGLRRAALGDTGQRMDPQGNNRCDAPVTTFNILRTDQVEDVARIASYRQHLPPLAFMPADELPDSLPPFGPGDVRADREGNVWIRTLDKVRGGSVYDVVDRQGELTARITVPAGRTIVGFGDAGAVYLSAPDANGVRLERARFR